MQSINPDRMDHLVEKVYTKVLEMVKEKAMYLNTDTNAYSLEPVQIPLADRLATDPDDSFSLNKYLSYQNEYQILKHTCLVCASTFDSAKYALKHFLIKHLTQRPLQKCTICAEENTTVGHAALFDLEQYLSHLCQAHLNSRASIEFSLIHVFDVFLLKTMQDLTAQYLMLGRFHMDAKLVAHLNKLHFGKETTRQSEKLLIRVYENFFQANTSAKLILRASSFKSNLIFNQFSSVELLSDLKSYLNLNLNLNDLNLSSMIRYSQCKLCLKLFDSFDKAQLHFAKQHTFNTLTNRLVSCPYCGQIVKSNRPQVNLLTLLNMHIIGSTNNGDTEDTKSVGCLAVRTQSMNLFNTFFVPSERRAAVHEANLRSHGISDGGSNNENQAECEGSMNDFNGVEGAGVTIKIEDACWC